ncbi:hypothetical protein BKA70DRAFT_1223761 [Coprinopsis sp. MPI-PUGE-AT-0042]|nr:hypothetical protein BKA70DRAFT_1223761 [Coprinopsis sp. MPI-PUGE-AT-0042]
MEGTNPEPGTYALISTRFSRYGIRCYLPWLGLFTDCPEAVAYPYIASPLQQWNLTSPDGVCWHIQNMESGRYLGLPIHEHARDFLALGEVDHKFSWHIKWAEKHLFSVFLYIPYSKHVVDLVPGKMNPGRVYLYQDGCFPLQTWYLCKDLHLDVSSTLKNGGVYKINKPSSSLSMNFEIGAKGVSCAKAGASDGHKFRALETDQGWVFQHVQTQRYLGIWHTISQLDEAVPVSTVGKSFTWIVIPYHENHKLTGGAQKFKIFEIWLPFTSRAVGLDEKVMLVDVKPDSEAVTICGLLLHIFYLRLTERERSAFQGPKIYSSSSQGLGRRRTLGHYTITHISSYIFSSTSNNLIKLTDVKVFLMASVAMEGM